MEILAEIVEWGFLIGIVVVAVLFISSLDLDD